MIIIIINKLTTFHTELNLLGGWAQFSKSTIKLDFRFLSQISIFSECDRCKTCGFVVGSGSLSIYAMSLQHTPAFFTPDLCEMVLTMAKYYLWKHWKGWHFKC